MKLYPLKFKPVFKYRIWGGEKLRQVLNKDCSEQSIGESWEVSGLNGDETMVKEGPLKGKTLKELIDKYKTDLVGSCCYNRFGNEFPLLIKFIDTAEPLSIQVHPNDEVAQNAHNSNGKNEMWYILEADRDAELIVGFKKDTNKSEIHRSINEGTLTDFLNIEKVEPGDVLYIPIGTVHAIGKGVTLIEIQQTSDITYRLYDYDRVDVQTGLKRELHIKNAIDVLDYTAKNSVKTPYKKELNLPNKLVHSPNFKTNFLKIKGKFSLRKMISDSFRILISIGGDAIIWHKNAEYPLKRGGTMLIPACLDGLEIFSEDAEIIEVFI